MNRKILVSALCLALVGATSPAWGACATPGNASKLKGNFAQLLSGFADTSPGGGPFATSNSAPESSTGVLTADGNGGFNATLTFNIGGTVCSGTASGTYCVNNDGTGTESGTFTLGASQPATCPPSGSENASFTIVDPNRVDFISTSSDTVLSGTAIRQNGGSGKGQGQGDKD